MNLDAYWRQYDKTLDRIRTEKPLAMETLKPILDYFHSPSSGVAFFPDGADDTLADALTDAGWAVEYIEGDYLWQARSPIGTHIHYVEGDVYPGPHEDPNRTEPE